MASSWRRALRRGLPVAAVAVGSALFAAGCGDDDDGGGEPQSVAIEATGSEGDVTYQVPSEASAGAAEIELTNSTGAPVSGQMAFSAESRSDDQVIAVLQNAMQGRPVADWFQGGGGVGTVAPGESATVTQDLQEGTYYVLGEDRPTTPLAKIEVSGGDGAELPETDGTVTASEYTFESDGLPSGPGSVLLENAGGQWHHFIAAQLKDDATIEDADEYLRSQGQGGGPPPFVGGQGSENPIETTVMEGGVSQVVDVDLQPGRYAFFCFISDKQGGPPHVVKGMVSEVTVEE